MPEPHDPDLPRVRCPFCRDTIAHRVDGVRCAKCATPHHRSCWQDTAGKCTVYGCGGTEARPFTRRSAARIVLAASRKAVASALGAARERLGGKVAAGLLLLTCLIAGVVPVHLVSRNAPPSVRAGLVAVPILAVLVAWMTALLYRGTELHDDLTLSPVQTSLDDYYRRLWSGLTGESGGGGGGCGGGGCDAGCVDAEGALLVLGILAVIAVALIVLPLVAWLVVELLVPVLVVGCYTVLYGGLAAAVNGRPELCGRLGACALRALLAATAYSSVVYLFAYAAFALRAAS